MPRENSLSDEGGRSLTPDLEDAIPVVANSPTYISGPLPNDIPLRSVKSRASHVSAQPRSSTLTPKERFRASVKKVMHIHRTSTALAKSGVGAEPGVDPRRHSAILAYGHIKANCVIEVVDYSGVRSSSGRMTNRSFVEMMNDPVACAREPWAKVRWINIGGISWDVLSALAVRYDLHPLAVEDVVHQRGQARSKVDYYQKHLFLLMLCHTLVPDDYTNHVLTIGPRRRALSTMAGLPRTFSPTPFSDGDKQADEDEDKAEYDEEKTMQTPKSPRARLSRLASGRSMFRKPAPTEETLEQRLERLEEQDEANRKQRAQDKVSIDAIKQGERINIKVEPMYLFLLRDGTVISIHPTPDLNFTAPIIARLRQRDSLLRSCVDPSMLLESLLDLIVDQALDVVDAYHGQILKLEYDILIEPKTETVRHLHILSGDLILHKRTLGPIKSVIYALRRYDVDHAAAIADVSETPDTAPVKVQGFMSHKSKIYLADVHDHMEYVLASLDMFSAISENLISYTFNMISYDMNNVMRQLTTVTIILLPLTFLTGYFGMNFQNMWSIHHNHTDIIFWIIAIPVMAIIMPLFLWRDLRRMWRYMQKRMMVKKAVKEFKLE